RADVRPPVLPLSPLPAIRFFRLSRYSGVASAPINGSSRVRVSRPVVLKPEALIACRVWSKLHLVQGRFKHPICHLTPLDCASFELRIVAVLARIECRMNSRLFILALAY